MKKHFAPDIISFAVIILNTLSVLCFCLPAGWSNYMPFIFVPVLSFFLFYSVFCLGVSGLLGVALNTFSLIYKRKKQIAFKKNIVYIILFALTIPLSWLLFNTAMSV